MDTFEIFGTIRNVGGVWQVLNDAGHQPLNIDSVSVVNGSSTSGYVRITYPAATKVGALLVTPDETCAKSCIHAGASVGLGEAFIYFGKNGVAIAPNTISNASANFWIYGKMWKEAV
ncbi:hypothetical protein J0X19_11810 [Hymenobacter sp. BT186]|uniref:Uncharacterized protein n=1 Tax=Hymenobacter telluris TaxID=2816474 RepID=A0A939JD80_9BACT|nr:hypothetical protein [Hymenobacter telluris]MBO0358633.1 hypothetical protein [Hymenobacter telluris]MBW3374659.1 hypothetical protein [Hymenobacter norwichensis]